MSLNHNNREDGKMKKPVSRSRSGLSLFEILAAMFVLMVGLLGVLAVLPFGIYQMNRVNKADFGGNCGRAAIQEIRIRNWADDFEDSLYDPYDSTNPDRVYNRTDDKLHCDKPIIVDPLLLAQYLNDPNFNTLQTYPVNSAYPVNSGGNGLPRVMSQFPGMKDANGVIIQTPSTWGAQTLNQVNDAFYWKDDRNFAAPASPNVQNPRPVGVTGASGIQSHENYSWLYMLTPQVRCPLDASGCASEENIIGYDVDVVVFFKRNVDLNTLHKTERSVIAVQQGAGGYRGGSFILYASDNSTSGQELSAVEALELPDTRWLLLSDSAANGTLFAKWYRIVNSGEIEPSNDTTLGSSMRRIMLLGPDIPGDVTISNATLIQGAIHVYSTVIKK
ncbi:MAG: hypothetical protein FWC43_01065 [Planctomycetaceae bacterium]|nr:hypothetical protein [Planctomycetaceae bacterium]